MVPPLRHRLFSLYLLLRYADCRSVYQYNRHNLGYFE